VLGAFLCAREAVCRLFTRPGGVLVTVSSSAARIGTPGEYVDDAAAKGARDTMTLGLAAEVAAGGICVHAVRPGASPRRGTQAAGRRTAWLV
jgi:NAD(P)-dependent dehydrogenase (short-subunit alcohol dehydrogenase family)